MNESDDEDKEACKHDLEAKDHRYFHECSGDIGN